MKATTTKRPKLLFIWNKDIKNPAAGGGTIDLFGFMRELTKRGYDVLFLTSRFPGAPPYECIDGVKVVRVGNMYTLFAFAPIRYLLNRELRSVDVIVDVVGFLPFIFPVFTRKPVVVLTWHLPSEVFFIELTEKHGKFVGFILASVAFFVERVVFPLLYKNRFIITFSEDTRKDLIRLGFDPDKVKMYLFALAENTMTLLGGNLTPLAVKDEKANFPLLLYLGRLRKYKGVHDAIRAMKIIVKEVPDARLYIVGKGEYAPKLKALVKKLGLEEYVKFLGFVPVEEKFKLLRQAHVLIMPSYKEGFATPIIEANLCGTVCVASDAMGVAWHVKHGVVG